MIKTLCRGCNSSNLTSVISLGQSPLANNLLNSVDENDELFPLEVVYCEKCHNAQLSYVVPPEKMFDNYLYVSSTAKSFRDHFAKAAEDYTKELKLSTESIVVDVGSNDGIALLPFAQSGIKVVGVEPASNIAKIANERNIETINSYFDKETAEKIISRFGHVDLVTASNVFAHSDLLKDITENVFLMLKEDGTFIIEVQYLVDTIKDMTFDNIYHEHVNYWSVTSLNNFFVRLGFVVTKICHVETHGGSIRAYVKRKDAKIDVSVKTYLDFEEEFGILKKETYEIFYKKMQNVKKNVNKNLSLLKDKGLKIAGYGSPAKATTALNYFEVGTNFIEYVVEDNSLKHNKVIPGVKIPIKPKEELNTNKPDVVVIMAWNFANEIKHNNKDLIESGIRFISIKDLQSEDFK
jgi:SAM-dependent methyltransferase